MPRKEYTIHYIYKITCTINGKYYIGMHSTFDLEDGYMGSGKRLKNSIKKYGLENHIKEILEYLPNRSSLKEREGELVNEELLNDSLCMNLQLGGEGGLSTIEHIINFKKSAKKAGSISGNIHKEKLLNDIEYRKKHSEKQRILFNKLHKENKLKPWPIGKKHKKSTIKKMRQSHVGKHSGSNNSQFGKCWITNGKENKKIFKGDLIPEGYKLGRKIN